MNKPETKTVDDDYSDCFPARIDKIVLISTIGLGVIAFIFIMLGH